jgi:hypothetical protein
VEIKPTALWLTTLLCLLQSVVACQPRQPLLDFRVRVDFSQVPELYGVNIVWDSLALQWDHEPLGPNPPRGHGVLLDSSWMELPAKVLNTGFVRAMNHSTSLYESAALVGDVGRVWPRSLRVEGVLASGRVVLMESILEPTSVKFPLTPGQKTTVEVVVIPLRNLGERRGTYALYVKSAQWAEGLSF